MAIYQNKNANQVVVAGDICLDILAVPRPPRKPTDKVVDNWRLTGEMRTHHMLGGACLLADFVECAIQTARDEAEAKAKAEAEAADKAETKEKEKGKEREKEKAVIITGPVSKPVIGYPDDLADVGGAQDPLSSDRLARLNRNEVVHSMLELCEEPDEKDKKKKIWRVSQAHGFSGPDNGNPVLRPWIEHDNPAAELVILDDTGNSFRKDESMWPRALSTPGSKPLVIYKLHRPLPGCCGPADEVIENKLWDLVVRDHHDRCVVVIDVNDLRDQGAVISRGLSWEKTALELVWHLRGDVRFAALRNCRYLIVRFGLDGALLYQYDGKNPLPDIQLIYDPKESEDGYRGKRKAGMVGTGSAFTAWLAVQFNSRVKMLSGISGDELNKKKTGALLWAVKEGLAASRTAFDAGFGEVSEEDPKYPEPALAELKKAAGGFRSIAIPLFRDAFDADPKKWTVLDALFAPGSRLEDTAERALREAEVTDLDAVPLGVFKDLRTYDRFEIEGYRSIFTIMHEYIHNPGPERPLSMAVFGPPGSGKSFGIKQVAELVRGDAKLDVLTFNLSQFTDTEELAAAFHLVRDSSVRGRIPLVFFDEFDTGMSGEKLFWLKHFLAPMQDGLFMDRGAAHPIGKAIFVFAGGIYSSFEKFNIQPEKPAQPGKTQDQPRVDEAVKDTDQSQTSVQTDAAEPLIYGDFKDAKGPDFVSRLRALLDITGIEHVGLPTASALLRRASILRFQLKNKAKGAFDVDGGLQIDPSLARALLQVPRYHHGVRSMEAILDMSRIGSCRHLTPSCLPPQEQMDLHVASEEFSNLLRAPLTFGKTDLDIIARAIHEDYLAQRKSDGTYDAAEPTHKRWEEFNELLEKDKETIDSNREQARMIPIRLRSIGAYVRKSAAGRPTEDVPPLAEKHIESLAKQEHDRWMAEKFRKGWIYGKPRDNDRRIHPCLLPWDHEDFPEFEKDKDRRTIRMIPSFLDAAGWEIIPPDESEIGNPSAKAKTTRAAAGEKRRTAEKTARKTVRKSARKAVRKTLRKTGAKPTRPRPKKEASKAKNKRRP
ncbi:AAA family ATPase [bacterium]|nr:AAA family ATPase [bacterium]